MRVLTRTYDLILFWMAFVAAATMLWLMVSVLVRNAGLQLCASLFTSSEYGILDRTLRGAPWLVRKKADVQIERVTAARPETAQAVVSRSVAFRCRLSSRERGWN